MTKKIYNLVSKFDKLLEKYSAKTYKDPHLITVIKRRLVNLKKMTNYHNKEFVKNYFISIKQNIVKLESSLNTKY